MNLVILWAIVAFWGLILAFSATYSVISNGWRSSVPEELLLAAVGLVIYIIAIKAVVAAVLKLNHF